MSRSAGWGIVTIASADLRRSPSHASELRSQLLLGEPIRILPAKPRDGWLEVESLIDGYRGWMKSWGFVAVGASALRSWVRRARLRVAAPIARIAAPEVGQGPLQPAFLGARLVRRSARSGRLTVELPDGRLGAMPLRAVAAAGNPRIGLASRLRSLHGTPYLWGGRTAAGFDCSGLVQVVFAEQGVALPRDARDQLRVCRRLSEDETPRLGDLVFFGRPREPVSHVGIALNSGTYVHCRGWVREASLDPSSPLCDKALLPQLRYFARPSSGPYRGR